MLSLLELKNTSMACKTYLTHHFHITFNTNVWPVKFTSSNTHDTRQCILNSPNFKRSLATARRNLIRKILSWEKKKGCKHISTSKVFVAKLHPGTKQNMYMRDSPSFTICFFNIDLFFNFFVAKSSSKNK